MIKTKKESIKNSTNAIEDTKTQLNNIKNNREFTSLTKEVEFQELEMKLSEENQWFKAKIVIKDGLFSTSEILTENKEDLV